MTEFLSLADLRALARDCLMRAGAPETVARAVAAEVAAAEAAGERANGMEALLRDIRLMRYGRLKPATPAQQIRARPGFIRLDAQHGFAAAALSGAMSDLAGLGRTQGIAVLRLERSSDPGGMICAAAALGERGLAVLAFGPDGPGRIGHPDLSGPALLPTPPRAALNLLFPDIDQDQPADSPIGGLVGHVGWLVVLDAGLAGDSFANAAIWDGATAPTTAASIACSAELLEQIVSA
ncbi:Ldh family oxidoreductase [Roseicyclus sp.]|uniref:Ldh family oxidoreductase n=1 Tax=Roseicyclus sp. TaxID=1914329 RepID=UPI003F6B80DA